MREAAQRRVRRAAYSVAHNPLTADVLWHRIGGMSTTPRKPGRPPDAGEPRGQVIRVRATAEELEQFDALGGASWFRRALRQAFARLQRKEGKPKA